MMLTRIPPILSVPVAPMLCTENTPIHEENEVLLLGAPVPSVWTIKRNNKTATSLTIRTITTVINIVRTNKTDTKP